MNTCKHSKAFVEFLQSLGWPVDLASHPGWDGNIRKAWNQGKDDDELATLRESEADLRQVSSMSTITGSEGAGSDSDMERDFRDGVSFQHENVAEEVSKGRDSPTRNAKSASEPVAPETREVDQILYFADVSCEVAFVVPALLPRYQRFRRMTAQPESSDEETGGSRPFLRRTRSGSTGSLESSSTSSLDSKYPIARQASEGTAMMNGKGLVSVDSRPLSKLSTHNTSSETNIVVAWLDQFDDYAYFPIDDVLMEFNFTRASRGGLGNTSLLEKETVVIFIHPLRSGLFRIHTRATIR